MPGIKKKSRYERHHLCLKEDHILVRILKKRHTNYSSVLEASYDHVCEHTGELQRESREGRLEELMIEVLKNE